MAITVTHPTAAIEPGDGDPNKIQPEDWNMNHTVVGTVDIANGGTGANSEAGARTNLGLGTIATQNSNNVSITGGSIAGVTIAGLDANTTFQDNADPTKQMRFELSGVSAGQTRILTVPDFDGTVATLAGAESLTNKTLVDTTNLEVTNLKAKDGTAAGTIADTTGVVTLASSVLTTTDINGGTIDGTIIGGAVPANGTFAALTSTGNATLGDDISADSHTINGNVVVANSGARDAFKITHTGLSGNAFVVEDDTSPDSSPFVITASGEVLQGYTTPLSTYYNSTSTPSTQNIRTAGAYTTNAAFTATSASYVILARSYGTTVGNYTAIPAADHLIGSISFQGSDGSDFGEAASIRCLSDGEFGTSGDTTDAPGYLTFSTSSNGSANPTERLRIDSSGRCWFSGTSGYSTYTQPVGNITTPYSTIAATGAPINVWGGISTMLNNWGASAQGAGLNFTKSFSVAPNTVGGAVSDGHDLGYILFHGDDGANFIRAAQILAEVDGTPGTNDMPGRLLFSTTADGASTPTERLRINSAGNIGIAATAKINFDGVAATGDTYIQESSANVLDLYAGGANTLKLSATGAAVTGTLTTTGNLTVGDAATDTLIVQAGTALLPSIIPTGDANTGLWFPAADTVAISTGGTEQVRVGSTGVVTLAGSSIVGPASFDAFNTVSTTLNIGGAATTLNLGAATGTLTVANTTLAAKAITASTTLDVTTALGVTGQAFASLPAAASHSGRIAKVTDIGTTTAGSFWVSNGSAWVPLNGHVVAYVLPSSVGAAGGAAETIAAQFLFPAGCLRVGDRIRINATMSKAGTSTVGTMTTRLGTAGTTSDTSINTGNVLAAANRSVGLLTEFKIASATTIQRLGVGTATVNSYTTAAATAFPSAVTISNISNALYLTVTITPGATDAVALEDCFFEIYAGN